jgi:hypothetical protein
MRVRGAGLVRWPPAIERDLNVAYLQTMSVTAEAPASFRRATLGVAAVIVAL